ISMVFISHNLAVTRHVSDRVAVMYLGRIVEAGTPHDVLTAPQHPYTRALVDSVPGLGSGAGAKLRLAIHTEPADPRNPPPGCRFHPRCPIGPATDPTKTECVDTDPGTVAVSHGGVACYHPLGMPQVPSAHQLDPMRGTA